MFLTRVWRAIQDIPRSAKVVLIASSALFLLNQNPDMSSNSAEPKLASKTRVPSAFIPHGGGPLPILGDSGHKSMVKFLSGFVSKYLSESTAKPSAVIVISAHWEESVPTIQSGNTSTLYYDYYGFPKESYNLDYPLQPAPELSKRVVSLLGGAGIRCKVDQDRGFDHGVFIPMMLLYPDGQIPTVQLSLISGLDPEEHVKLGEALAPLREEGVFILGSGMSYHNMRGFRSSNANEDSVPFHKYLREFLADNGKSYEEKKEALQGWKKAPKALDVHPREEHLIPLMVLLGSAKGSGGKAKEVFFDDVGGAKCAGYVFED